jgi:hypothetical protein
MGLRCGQCYFFPRPSMDSVAIKKFRHPVWLVSTRFFKLKAY